MKKIKQIKQIKIFIVIIFSITLFSQCEKIQLNEIAKISDFKIYQNHLSSDSIYEYDSLYFYILPLIYDNDFINPPFPPEYNPIVLDYYKSLNITTIYNYSAQYSTNDNILNLFSFYYYYDSFIVFYNPSDNFSYEKAINMMMHGLYGKPNPFTYYQNFNQFFTSDSTYPSAFPLKLFLNTPPDSTVLFQIKAEIELLDGRQFTLYSEPVYIKP